MQEVDWGHDKGTCRYGLYDTEEEAWQAALAALEHHRDRVRDAVWLMESQLKDVEMWLEEYRRNHPKNQPCPSTGRGGNVRALRHLRIGLFVTTPRLQFHMLHRHDKRGFCR